MDNVIPYSVSPHCSLNTKKGVIRCPYIKDCTDEEILEGLKDANVIKLDRITVFRNFSIDISKPDLTTIYQGGLLQGGWLCHSLFLIKSEVINVRNLATLNSTAGKIKFAINVGKKIILTHRNVKK